MPEHAKYNYWQLCGISGGSSGREHEVAVPDRARERHREPDWARQHQPSRTSPLTGPSATSRKMGAESRLKQVILLLH